jgi:hypothetical protein
MSVDKHYLPVPNFAIEVRIIGKHPKCIFDLGKWTQRFYRALQFGDLPL